jgi:prepilin-type N-terminal cleavage/methylation domain-containing protein
MKKALRSRHGMTLIELVVVMVILVALAGVAVTVLPGILTQAHTATCATNISATSTAILTYQGLNSSYPNNWDALSDGSTMITYFAGGSALPAKFGGPGTNQAGGQVTGSALTAPEVSALANAGIVTVQLMATAPNDPTFDNYSSATPTSVTIGTTAKMAVLDPTGGSGPAFDFCVAHNWPTTGRYVLLGIGPRSDLIRNGLLTAPIHYGDTPPLNPEFGYERLVGIFKVSDTAVKNFTTARFFACAPVHDDGIGSIDDEIQNFYQLQNGGS